MVFNCFQESHDNYALGKKKKTFNSDNEAPQTGVFKND